jgi:hypothetical protein
VSCGAEAPALGPSGSFELHLDAIDNPCPYAPIEDESARYGRIDLRPSGDGYVAFVSLAKGTTRAFKVTATPGQFVLEGEVIQYASQPSLELTWGQTWTRIVLNRIEDGSMSGQVTATGQATAFDGGDNSCTSPTTARGTVAEDHTGASLTPALPLRKGPPKAMLPWESLSINASEPVDAAALVAATEARVPDGPDPLPLRTTTSPQAPDDGAGVRELQVSTPAWEQIRGKTLSISVRSAIPDPAGNPSINSPGTFEVLDVGAAASSLVLDGSVPVGLWGAASPLPAGAPCEEAGCVTLGSASVTCSPPASGVAARVLISGAKTIKVRLQVSDLATPQGVSFSIRASDKKGHQIDVDASQLIAHATTNASGQETRSADWQTITIPIAGLLEGDEAGVDIVAGPRLLKEDCIFPVISGTPEVRVAKIWADPG